MSAPTNTFPHFFFSFRFLSTSPRRLVPACCVLSVPPSAFTSTSFYSHDISTEDDVEWFKQRLKRIVDCDGGEEETLIHFNSRSFLMRVTYVMYVTCINIHLFSCVQIWKPDFEQKIDLWAVSGGQTVKKAPCCLCGGVSEQASIQLDQNYMLLNELQLVS